MNDFFEKQLINRFEKKNAFSRSDLYDFYREFEPELNEGTFGWRIYDLKKKNLIKSIGRGIYTLDRGSEYVPNINAQTKKIARLLAKRFSDLEYCIWATSLLNEFANHQANTYFTVLEVERDYINSAFYTLQEENVKDLYLQPDEKEIDLYVLNKENPVVLKFMVSRAPLLKLKDKNFNFSVPTLEKILIDLFCDRDTFYFYSGEEMKAIFKNAFDRYLIDYSRLFAYAARRGREKKIKDYIGENIKSLPEAIAQ
jgi:hypothetical protein